MGLIDALLERGPRTADAYLDRGVERWSRGDNRGALADLDEAVRLDPGNVPAHVARGNALSSIERYPEALAAYDRALDIDPRSTIALSQRASTNSIRGRDDLALPDLDRALELDPDHEPARAVRAEVNLERGEDAAALADAEVVVRRQPTWARGFWFRGWARVRTGDLDGGIADYDTAIALLESGEAFERAPRFLVPLLVRRSEAYFDRGIERSDAEDLRSSALDGDRLIAMMPDLGAGYFIRGRALAQFDSGETQAKADLEKARTMATDADQIAMIDDLLSWLEEEPAAS